MLTTRLLNTSNFCTVDVVECPGCHYAKIYFPLVVEVAQRAVSYI